MSVSLKKDATHCRISLEGQVTLASAAELKAVLLQWLAAGQNTPLELDLESVEEVDITILQLLASAAREAARTSARIGCRASNAVVAAAHGAGFDQIPGFPISEFPISE